MRTLHDRVRPARRRTGHRERARSRDPTSAELKNDQLQHLTNLRNSLIRCAAEPRHMPIFPPSSCVKLVCTLQSAVRVQPSLLLPRLEHQPAPHATVYILLATPATGRARHLSTLSVPTHAPSSNVRSHALPARVHLRTNHMQGGTSHQARSASLVDFCRAISRAAGTI